MTNDVDIMPGSADDSDRIAGRREEICDLRPASSSSGEREVLRKPIDVALTVEMRK
jgi:hypothetical protein